MTNAVEMQSRGFSSPGDPGSARESQWKRDYLVKALAVPSVKTLWVHRSSVETFNALILILQRNGAELGRVVDDWGFANRGIRGASSFDSMHKYAKAIDADATENPQHALTTTFPVRITHKAIDEDLLDLVWGFDWRQSFRDPMHFEDQLSRRRRRWIAWRITHPTPRSRKLAKLANMKPREFRQRIKRFEKYPG